MPSELVELMGHLVDSLILPKVLDAVLELGGSFTIERIDIGQRQDDPSYVLIRVTAPGPEALASILNRIGLHGADVVRTETAGAEA